MSQPKGSVGVAIGMAVIIVIAVTSLGYYQFVLCTPTSCATTTTASTTTAAPTCTPPSCLTIAIVPGAATIGQNAYKPDSLKLVIGVNNTFEVLNNDSTSGGVFHSLTARTCPSNCPFDTGIIAYNITAGPFTITTAGTYPFYCEVHPTTMNGTITVVAGAGGTGTSSSATTTTSTISSKSSGPPPGALIAIPKGASTNENSPGFSPDTATVIIGVNNTISWTNNDVAGHTVEFTSVPPGAKVSNSQLIGPGQFFTQTLTVPGTYDYICSLHSWMKGTIIVKSA